MNQSNDHTDRLKAFEIYRQRAVDEYNFISQRLNLLVLVEGVLLALFATALSASNSDKAATQTILDANALNTVLGWTVFFGILVSVFSFLSVLAAVWEVEHLKRTYSTRYLDDGDPTQSAPWLKLTGHGGRYFDFHVLGHLLPISLPIIVVFLWAAIAAPMIFN